MAQDVQVCREGGTWQLQPVGNFTHRQAGFTRLHQQAVDRQAAILSQRAKRLHGLIMFHTFKYMELLVTRQAHRALGD